MLQFILGVAVLVVLAGCQPRQENLPIVAAVVRNDVAVVREYLAKGGDVAQVSRDGDPLVYLASGPQGGPEVLRLLLAAGGDVNARSAKGRTPLQNAASWCDIDTIRVLLAAGADISLVGAKNMRAIDSVCAAPKSRREATLRVLVAAGADS